MKFQSLTITPLAFSLASASWDYTNTDIGPSHWSDQFSTCSGDQQSPIDVPSASSFTEDIPESLAELLTGFSFNYTESLSPEFRRSNSHYELEDLGKTVEIHTTDMGFKLTNASNLAYIVGRSDTTDVNEYTLEQLHFHWGRDDNEGSEHTVAGVAYPLELHFVHYNSYVYESFGDAVASGNQDALLVVGVFFDVYVNDPNNATALSGFLPLLNDHENFTAGDEGEVELSLSELVSDLGSEERKFWLYAGGLTTPGCNEIVTWVVMKEPVAISEEVLEALRGVVGDYDNGKGPVSIAPNFRPTQSLVGREVFDAESETVAKIDAEVEAPAATAKPVLMMIMGLVSAAVFLVLL